MKNIKIILIFLFQLLVVYTWAQDKSEYRYFAIKFGVVNNFVPFPESNENLLVRTPLGDMALQTRKVINYTPGGSFSIYYHIDAQSNKFGVVFGIQAQNYGYTISYMSMDSNFYATDMFRATSVVIPFYIKYNPHDIFINQSYLTVGFKQYVNLIVKEYQTGTWLEGMRISPLTLAQVHRLTSSFFIGYNYNIGFVELEYNFRDFINKDFKTSTQEGIVRPFSNIDYRMRLYLTFGLNIPINRWMTMKSWSAERIRRMFSPVR